MNEVVIGGPMDLVFLDKKKKFIADIEVDLIEGELSDRRCTEVEIQFSRDRFWLEQ